MDDNNSGDKAEPVTMPAPRPSAAAEDDAPPEPEACPPALEHARRFLQDDAVQQAPREEKAKFLRSKGISETDIESLLDEEGQAAVTPVTKEESEDTAPTDEEAAGAESETAEEMPVDRPPIVTYPEFLARRERPPPLITPSGFLQTASVLAGFATLVYGASQYVLAPMAASLTDARAELHEHASKGLGALVSKLEDAVSELPVTASAAAKPAGGADNDAASSCGDPAEVFHRDVGVQTVEAPATPPPRQQQQHRQQDAGPAKTPSEAQARRVSGLVASLREVNRGLVAEGEEYADIKTVLDVFGDDLGRLSRPYSGQLGGGWGNIYGAATRQEPDDEVRAVKENIRRVKGVLLSARRFPTVNR